LIRLVLLIAAIWWLDSRSSRNTKGIPFRGFRIFVFLFSVQRSAFSGWRARLAFKRVRRSALEETFRSATPKRGQSMGQSTILPGMHLIHLGLGVTSGSGRCRRLSANHCFVGEPIFSRRRLLRLFIRGAMAGRFLLSQLHQRSSLEIIAGSLALFWMSQTSFRSGWNGFPRHTSANENLVSSDVVYHQSEKWGERSGAAKSSRPWQLPDGLVKCCTNFGRPW
jgi:hypothetical protein